MTIDVVRRGWFRARKILKYRIIKKRRFELHEKYTTINGINVSRILVRSHDPQTFTIQRNGIGYPDGHHSGTQSLRHRPREEAPLIPGRTAPRPRVVPMLLTRREHSSGRTGTESASKHEKHRGRRRWRGRRRRGEREGQSEARGRQKKQKFGGLLEINTGKRPPS